MEGENSQNFYNQKHGINIALASQMRLHDILNRIVNLEANYPIDSAEKQKIHLSLVKQYVISAIPYLSDTDAKSYKDKVLGMHIKRKTNVNKGNQKFSFVFDVEMDKELNEILMEIQQKLRHLFSKIVDDEDEEGL